MQKKKKKKKIDTAFCFSDNCIWIGCIKLTLLRREYLWLVVNVLTNSAKILHIPKGGFFQLNCLYSYQ